MLVVHGTIGPDCPGGAVMEYLLSPLRRVADWLTFVLVLVFGRPSFKF